MLHGLTGELEESGDVHLIFDFTGPAGIAYPQYQPSVDSYDERNRTNLPEDVKSKMAEEQAIREKKITAKVEGPK